MKSVKEDKQLICCHGGTPHPKGEDCYVPKIPKGKHEFVLQRHFAAPYLNRGLSGPYDCGRCGEILGPNWRTEPCYG